MTVTHLGALGNSCEGSDDSGCMRNLLLIVAALALLGAACGGSDSETGAGSGDALSVSDAWSRQPAEGQTVGVVYGTVSNPGDDDVRLVSATSSVTGTVELHETLMDDNGAMSMQQVDEGFVVPAGGEFVFEPGGPHVMLLGIDPASFPTDAVDVELTTDDGAVLAFDAEVRAIGGGMDDMDMEDMDHGEDTDEGHDAEGHDMEDMEEDSMDEGSMELDNDAILEIADMLHQIDIELTAGDMEPIRQLAIVSPYVEMFSNQPDSETTVDALNELIDALKAEDLDRSHFAAGVAHQEVHGMEEHDHG